jgi:hypothetical protein
MMILFAKGSSKEMSTQKKKKVLLAGTAMLLLFAATLSFGPAMAQSNGDDLDEKERKKVRPQERPDKERPHRNGTFVMGMGAAIEDNGDAYRSGMKLALAKNADDAAATDIEYTVRKGMVVINDEGSPVRYPVVADTWSIEFNEDAFHAAGVVEDADGNTYDVSVRGEALGKTKHGILYQVQGTFDGADGDYDLYYFVVVNEKQNRDRPSTSESDSVNDSA